MIRFVEVSGINPDVEGTTHFGFWNTVIERLVEFSGQVLFESLDEWEEAASDPGIPSQIVDRCRRLVPAWVKGR